MYRTDITTVEELSIFCRWVEKGVPLVEHLLGIVLLKKADAVIIYSLHIDKISIEIIQLGKLVGVGFDGAATFSGKYVQWYAEPTEKELPLSSTAVSMCASC